MNGPGQSGNDCVSSPRGWTLDTLEEYLTSKLDALGKLQELDSKAAKEAVQSALNAVEKQSTAAMAAAEKAILKSDTATEKRFDSVNEFRQTLSDQASDFLSRKEYEANHKSLEEKIITVTSRMTRFESVSAGKDEGVKLSWGVFLGAVSAAAVVAGALGFTFSSSSSSSRTQTPQVFYLPAPLGVPPAPPIK